MTIVSLTILVSCDDAETEIVDTPLFVLQIDANYSNDLSENHYLLVTTTDNQRIAYIDVSRMGDFQVYPEGNIEVSKYNIHYVSYDTQDQENLLIKSSIGLSGDTIKLTGEEVYLRGINTATTKVNRLSLIGTDYLAAVGSIFFTENGFFDANIFDRYSNVTMFENYDHLYYVTKGSAKEGYILIPSYVPPLGPIDFSKFQLNPLRDMTSLTYQTPNEYNLTHFSIQALLKDDNDSDLGRVQIHENWTNINDDIEALFPTGEKIIDQYRIFLNARSALVENRWHTSTLYTKEPSFPDFLNTYVELQNPVPGAITLQVNGDYDEVSYTVTHSAPTGNLEWTVSFSDEALDYASYPDFPDEFYLAVPFGSVQSFLRNELGQNLSISTQAKLKTSSTTLTTTQLHF